MFEPYIPMIFMEVWDAVPENRSSLTRVLDTWKDVFPCELVQHLEGRIHGRTHLGQTINSHPYGRVPQGVPDQIWSQRENTPRDPRVSNRSNYAPSKHVLWKEQPQRIPPMDPVGLDPVYRGPPQSMGYFSRGNSSPDLGKLPEGPCEPRNHGHGQGQRPGFDGIDIREMERRMSNQEPVQPGPSFFEEPMRPPVQPEYADGGRLDTPPHQTQQGPAGHGPAHGDEMMMLPPPPGFERPSPGFERPPLGFEQPGPLNTTYPTMVQGGAQPPSLPPSALPPQFVPPQSNAPGMPMPGLAMASHPIDCMPSGNMQQHPFPAPPTMMNAQFPPATMPMLSMPLSQPAASGLESQQAAPAAAPTELLLSSLLSSGIISLPPPATQSSRPAEPISAEPVPSQNFSLQSANGSHHPGGPAGGSITTLGEVKAAKRLRSFADDVFHMQNPAAVLALLDSSEKLRVKHLEFKFQRRRLLRATQTSSRAWYVSAEAWVSGKRPHSEAVSGVFFGTEEVVKEEEPAMQSVPADDSQPLCAISGEKFEEFFDERNQEWRYKDARRLTGQEAAAYGVHDGAIVLVSCLTSAGGVDSDVGAAVACDLQQVSAELSEAAQGENIDNPFGNKRKLSAGDTLDESKRLRGVAPAGFSMALKTEA
uniref:Pre-mRNA cleavage complex 2 protein Pcf11 n=1 Tax=Tetraselmis sp. GSL018 TaxID=582737 RepID=A0A061QNK9_9CHLO